jgi:hypothetical protein
MRTRTLVNLTQGQEVIFEHSNLFNASSFSSTPRRRKTCGIFSIFLHTLERRIEEDPEDEDEGEEQAPKKKTAPRATKRVPAPKLPVLMPEPTVRPPPRRKKPNALLALYGLIPGRRSASSSSCLLTPEKGRAQNFLEARKISGL